MLKRALKSSPAELLSSPPQVITLVCLELWDVEAYISILSRQIDQARADGALAALPQTLGPLGAALLVKGQLRAAEALLEEAEALAAATGMPTVYPRVHLAALRGNLPEARKLFDAVVADAGARARRCSSATPASPRRCSTTGSATTPPPSSVGREPDSVRSPGLGPRTA